MNNEKQVDVCVSLISHNTARWLEGSLNSIYQTPPRCKIEVWVVDNVCSDGTSEMVKKKFPKVNIIRNTSVQGFGANHNQVFAKARSKYILILNEDTVLQPDTIDTMVRFMDTHPDAGAASCKVFLGDARLQHSAGRFPTFFGELLYFGGNIVKEGKKWYERYKFMEDWNYDEVRVVDWASGCFLLVRSDILQRIGGFHKDIFAYYEDAEWCLRMKRQTGLQTYFVSTAKIVHYHGQSFDPQRFDREYLAFKGSCVYIRTAYGVLAEKVYRMSCVALWFAYYCATVLLHALIAGRSVRLKTKKDFYHYCLFEVRAR